MRKTQASSLEPQACTTHQGPWSFILIIDHFMSHYKVQLIRVPQDPGKQDTGQKQEEVG